MKKLIAMLLVAGLFVAVGVGCPSTDTPKKGTGGGTAKAADAKPNPTKDNPTN